MKATVRILLFIGLWAISHSVFAQDTIVFKTGEEIKAIIQEVGLETVKYKKYTNIDGPVYTVYKSDIFMMKYQSGKKDVFSSSGDESQSVKKSQTSEDVETSDIHEILSKNRERMKNGSKNESQQTTDNKPKEIELQRSDNQFSGDYALLHIYRPNSMVGRIVSYDLHLDDEVVFLVKNESKTTIRITSEGTKTLWAKTESKVKLPVDIQFGHEYYIRCGVKMGLVVGRPTLKIVDNGEGKEQYDKISSD